MVVPFSMFLCLFRFHVVPRSTGALCPRFNRVITRDRRLVLIRRRVEEVCLSVRQLPADVAPKGRSSPANCGRPSPPREMGAPLHETRAVAGHFPFVYLGLCPRVSVPLLRSGEGLISGLRESKAQVAVFRASDRFIFVTVKRAINAIAFYLGHINAVG